MSPSPHPSRLSKTNRHTFRLRVKQLHHYTEFILTSFLTSTPSVGRLLCCGAACGRSSRSCGTGLATGPAGSRWDNMPACRPTTPVTGSPGRRAPAVRSAGVAAPHRRVGVSVPHRSTALLCAPRAVPAPNCCSVTWETLCGAPATGSRHLISTFSPHPSQRRHPHHLKHFLAE